MAAVQVQSTGRLILVLVALVAVLTAGGRNAERATAAGTPSPDLSIGLVGGVACSTQEGFAGLAADTCVVEAGTQFTIGVDLSSLDGLADVDGDTEAGYFGVAARLDYSSGLTRADRIDTTEIVGVWPDCFFDAEADGPGTYVVGCVVASGANGSTFVGRVAEVDFTCTPGASTGNTISLVHGAPIDSLVLNELGDVVLDENDKGATETLTITCAAAPFPELSIDAIGKACSTRPGESIYCRLPIGEQFTIGAYIDDLNGSLPDINGDTVGGYDGVQALLSYTGGLALENRPSFTEMVWPEPKFCSEIKGVDPGTGISQYLGGCALALGAPHSTFTGRVMETDFTCPQAPGLDTVSLLHGNLSATLLITEIFSPAVDLNDGGAPETLTIDCAFVWDVTGDGTVSVGDIYAVVSSFGLMVPPALTAHDIDWNGVVSVADITAVVQHFGQMAP